MNEFRVKNKLLKKENQVWTSIGLFKFVVKFKEKEDDLKTQQKRSQKLKAQAQTQTQTHTYIIYI